MLTLNMSKKRKKGTYKKKTSQPEFLLQLIYFMKRFWLTEENVRPWLADRLQQFTHFPLIQNQSSVGSWIFVRRTLSLTDVVVSTVIYKSLSTTGLCTHQCHFQGLLKFEISVFVLRISLHTHIKQTEKKNKKTKKKQSVQSNLSHPWYKRESHHIWKKQ